MLTTGAVEVDLPAVIASLRQRHLSVGSLMDFDRRLLCSRDRFWLSMARKLCEKGVQKRYCNILAVTLGHTSQHQIRGLTGRPSR